MILSAGSTIARASSGSRSRIISVEPLMSANSAVTVLRSPSSVVEASGCSGVMRTVGPSSLATGDGLGAPVPGAASSGAAHSSQNLALGVLTAPHRGHFAGNAVAHSLQNFVPSRLSLPHFAQRMFSFPTRRAGLGVFQVGSVEAFGEPVIDFREH